MTSTCRSSRISVDPHRFFPIFSNSSRGPRRYDSMPARYDHGSFNNRQSYSSNFSRPPVPYEDSRSSSTRSSGNTNPRPGQNISSGAAPPQPPPLPPPLIPPPPPPALGGAELFQSVYRQYYDMYMQQATALSSSSQTSATNSM